MAHILKIHHVTLVVDDLDAACSFYESVFGLKPLPTFNLDFPAQFYRINDAQQLHLTEWDDAPSYRGHVCFQVDDFNAVFYRMRDEGRIDTAPWGKVRRLPDGAMQMFIRDPSDNLVEISCAPETPVDDAIFTDTEWVQGEGVYVSQRDDGRGRLRSDDATLYHNK